MGKIERKSAKIIKNMHNKWVCQHLGATLKCWLTPKPWSTPGGKVILCAFSSFFQCVTEKNGKTCLNAKNMISAGERLAKHTFARRNTQHMCAEFKLQASFVKSQTQTVIFEKKLLVNKLEQLKA